jgi:hypothetical protein
MVPDRSRAFVEMVAGADIIIGRVGTHTPDIEVLYPPDHPRSTFTRSVVLRSSVAPASGQLVIGFFNPLQESDGPLLLCTALPPDSFLAANTRQALESLPAQLHGQDAITNLILMTAGPNASWYHWHFALLSTTVQSFGTAKPLPARFVAPSKFFHTHLRPILAVSIIELAAADDSTVLRSLVQRWSRDLLQVQAFCRVLRAELLDDTPNPEFTQWYGKTLVCLLHKLDIFVVDSSPAPDPPAAPSWKSLHFILLRMMEAWQAATLLDDGVTHLPWYADSTTTDRWVVSGNLRPIRFALPHVVKLWRRLSALAPDPPTLHVANLSPRAAKLLLPALNPPPNGRIPLTDLPDEQVIRDLRGIGYATVTAMDDWIRGEFRQWCAHVEDMAARELPSTALAEALDDLLNVFGDD